MSFIEIITTPSLEGRGRGWVAMGEQAELLQAK
jgi:hypothetical protein